MVKKKVKNVKRKSVSEQPKPLDPQALRYLRYKVGGKYTAERNLFIKRDLGKENSLIVTNVPAFLGEDVVLAFLNNFAPFEMEESYVQRSNSADGSLLQGQLTVTVTYVKVEAVDHVLRKCQDVGPLTATDFIEEPKFASVLDDATSLYKRLFPSAEQIEEMAETYMERYDTEQLEAKREAKRKYSEPDEDGWITVTKGKKAAKSQKLRKEDVPLIGGLSAPAKKKQKLDLTFYTFQAKKDKHKKAQELLKKFEEDKKRIAQLKQARNFKPT